MSIFNIVYKSIGQLLVNILRQKWHFLAKVTKISVVLFGRKTALQGIVAVFLG
jgi:hypothetical protein